MHEVTTFALRCIVISINHMHTGVKLHQVPFLVDKFFLKFIVKNMLILWSRFLVEIPVFLVLPVFALKRSIVSLFSIKSIWVVSVTKFFTQLCEKRTENRLEHSRNRIMGQNNPRKFQKQFKGGLSKTARNDLKSGCGEKQLRENFRLLDFRF